MQVLKITIANDIKQYLADGSEVVMFVPLENVTAIFHSPSNLPVVLVGDKQYSGTVEILSSELSSIIESETKEHQEKALTSAEFDMVAESQAND